MEPVSLEDVKEGLRYFHCEIGCVQFDKEYCEGLFRGVYRNQGIFQEKTLLWIPVTHVLTVKIQSSFSQFIQKLAEMAILASKDLRTPKKVTSIGAPPDATIQANLLVLHLLYNKI